MTKVSDEDYNQQKLTLPKVTADGKFKQRL